MYLDHECLLADLMARGLEGEAAAWDTFYAELLKVLKIYFSRRLEMGSGDLEDLVQITVIAVLEQSESYDPSRPLGPWIYALARYKLIDYWRRQKGRVFVPIEDVADWLPSPMTEDGLLAGMDVDRMLASLPKNKGQLLRDVKLAGLSMAEAGARANLSEGAAKVAIHRAMKTLEKAELGLSGRR